MKSATFGQSPYLSTKHAAQYLDQGIEAFYAWTRRENVQPLRQGRRRLLWDRRDLDAAIHRTRVA